MRQVLLLVGMIGWILGLLIYPGMALAQNFNVASTYPIADKDIQSGDIVISNAKGLVRTNITYDNRIFGVVQSTPLLVLREASQSGQAVIRAGDSQVNICDCNGDVKQGDFVTTSQSAGKGMKAGQSGYVLGIAMDDAQYIGQPVSVEGKNYRTGSVNVALRIEYAEISTARSNVRLLTEINSALFKTVQNPEKAVLIIRYLIAGLLALLAIAIGFFAITRSVSKSIEAIGRNPLARRSILISVLLQIGIVIIGWIITVVIVFVLIRV